jgi:hypothetical protein
MSRPFKRTAILTEGERQRIKKVMVTTKNAFATLEPALKTVSWNQFRLALMGKPAEPVVLTAIRAAFATWKSLDRPMSLTGDTES